MPKKSSLTVEEKKIFEEAMRGIKPMNYSKIHPKPASPPPKPKKVTETNISEQLPFSDFETLEKVSSDAILFFSRPGIHHKILRKMRAGQYNVEASLDLHGMTVAEARTTLSQFILDCRDRGIRFVLIIHGKGRGHHNPILKNKLNHWLRQTDLVLAFSSAAPKDGRTGALYVLLRS